MRPQSVRVFLTGRGEQDVSWQKAKEIIHHAIVSFVELFQRVRNTDPLSRRSGVYLLVNAYAEAFEVSVTLRLDGGVSYSTHLFFPYVCLESEGWQSRLIHEVERGVARPLLEAFTRDQGAYHGK